MVKLALKTLVIPNMVAFTLLEAAVIITLVPLIPATLKLDV
jgi:hypothetical protein